MIAPVSVPVPLDRLSAVLERFRVRTHLFHAGPLCGLTQFAAQPGRGFLHVLRRGELLVQHRARSGAPRRLRVAEPTLLFYPRPLAHDFHNAPAEGSDFVCATLDFEGGADHPLVRALPSVVVLPLREVPQLEHSLALLFAETGQLLCGQRVLVDRLFEVVLIQLLRWLLDHPAQAGTDAGLLAGLAHPQLARALVAMHERPGEDWNLQRLAAVAGMSRSAFAVAFKRQVGTAPAEHLLQWRVSLSQHMLRQGRSVKQVADALGYGTASSFARAFGACTGVSPREWLQQARADALA
jgi:AraC-like DNA-binding protein